METLLNVKEAAGLLRISKSLLYQLAENGEVPHVRLRSRLLFDPAKLREWVELHSVPVAG